MKKIGFVGLGDMGLYMSRNLLKAGYPVKGFDISAQRMQQFQENGGIPCANSAEVGKDTQVAIIMVVTADQVESVLFDKNGLLETLEPGSIIMITATIAYQKMTELAARVAEHGIQIVDCPVTGGQIGADAGTLTLMPSAPEAALKACEDIFAVIGSTVVVTGDKPGAGQVVKACASALAAITTVGTCESVALGAKAGVDPEVILRVLGSGTCGSPLFRNYVEKIMDRTFYHGGVQLKLMYKDSNLAMDLAKECGVPLYSTAAANEMLHAGFAKYPDADSWVLVKLLEDVTGVEVVRREKEA